MKIRKIYYLFALICSMGVFASCSDDKSSDAQILSFVFNGDAIKQTPTINHETGEVTFIAPEGTDITALTPEITISSKATINPASGVKQDFTNGVKYTVTAEDGSLKVYNVVKAGSSISYDFEEWVKGVEGQEPDMTFYEVANGWSSSNTGAHFLKALPASGDFEDEEGPRLADKYVVTETLDAKSGQKAARIETIDTKGLAFFVNVPKVTSGSLFIGKFETDIMNTLNSTKFGMEFSRKPLSLKGYYKYEPGKTYFRCESPATCHIAVEDPNTTDQCSINAVLYEVSTFDDPDYTEYLTGVDVNDPTKLTAVATLQDGTAKAEYTSFEIKFNYLKPYDPAKKYRFAIICSSSKDGDKFNGAPGSVLIVDNFELVVE